MHRFTESRHAISVAQIQGIVDLKTNACWWSGSENPASLRPCSCKQRGARVTVSDAKSEDATARTKFRRCSITGIAVETGGHGERTFREQDLDRRQSRGTRRRPAAGAGPFARQPVIGEIELAARFICRAASSPSPAPTARPPPRPWPARSSPPAASNRWSAATSVLRPSRWSTNRRPRPGLSSKSPAFSWKPFETFRPHSCRHSQRHARPSRPPRLHWKRISRRQGAHLREPDAEGLRRPERRRSRPAWNSRRASRPQVYWFSRKKEVKPGRVSSATVKSCFRDAAWSSARSCRSDEITLKGAHNLENVLAGICVGVADECAPAEVRQAVQDFKAVEHRLEYVATIRGVAVLQRFQGHQRRCHHQGARIVSRQHPPHPRRQGQRQRLHRAERSACVRG